MKYAKDVLALMDDKLGEIKFKRFSKDFMLEDLCERSAIDYDSVLEVVSIIEKGIVKGGDEELRRLTKKFDGVQIESLLVTKSEILRAEGKVTKKLKTAIQKAAKNIKKFHVQQVMGNLPKTETSKGVKCWQEFRAIEKIGLYIPGGTAPLFSTLLMLAIPAKIAGCKKVVVCTPPQKDESINPAILVTAKIVGISEIYKVGGAQAIFAMSQGTETILKVDKIFGPGNSFVTAAKMKISKQTAIDMPAGPSEVLVVADKNAKAEYIASDLLSQAEHGEDSQVVLVTTSENLVREVLKELTQQLDDLPRKDVAKKSLKSSFIVVVDSLGKALEVSNKYAPEHLILHIDSWKKYLTDISNAGSVFCGGNTPESAGDYASGTNHTLPTSGFARSFSGVSVESFGKRITFQSISKKGIRNLGETIKVMAEAEDLMAHKNAVSVRLKRCK